ncbi:hypothetical protein [Opitutus sp. ER46]|uniref:hypothetical protein n=1 Tax=Opitutus sp. ER46 TaxID=2161864 RepID=UPI000D31BCBF|nr:hypothetical protein [Opitutus sp. ER46]PTX90915.1 hypothetical protein DB354_19890 [Opitutus sp. ER46]
MKFVFLAGGFAGFLVTGCASYWAGHQPDRIFFDGAVGCLVGAMLFRWFWTILVRGIRETIIARNAATAASAAANAAAKQK